MMRKSYRFLLALACLTLGFAAPCVADDLTLPGLENQASSVTRESILNGQRWHKLMVALNDWLNDQRLYSDNQVDDFKRKIIAASKTLSARQLTDFMDDMEAKVQILNSKEARSAQRWMQEQLRLASDAYDAKLRSRLPDLYDIKAPDLQDFLTNFEVRVASTKKFNQEVAQGREQQVQTIEKRQEENRAYQERALDRAVESQNINGGYYGGSGGYGVGYGIGPAGYGAGWRW
jgi:hypothetical protein